MYLSICMIPSGQCTRTEQVSSPTSLSVATNTKLSCIKLMATPPGLNPWKTRQRGGDLGPAPRLRKDERTRHSIYTPGTGQQNIRSLQTENLTNEHDLSARPSILSPAQLEREGDSDMEVSLHWSIDWGGSCFPRR